MTRRLGCAGMSLAALLAVVAVVMWLVRPPLPGSPPHSQVAPAVSTTQLSQLAAARVVRVVDGDTIDVLLDGDTYRLRYIGVDTPERNERYYQAATAANRRLVSGRTVYLEKDVSETDRYGRLLRYVYRADGRMVNEILVADGLAFAATFPPDVRHTARFQAAQRRAQAAGRGMWAE